MLGRKEGRWHFYEEEVRILGEEYALKLIGVLGNTEGYSFTTKGRSYDLRIF